MAKIVDEIPGRQYYPWAEWFDGQARLLEPGIDFTCEAEGMRSAAYGAAKQQGLKVIARIRPEGVYVKSLGKRTVKAAPAAEAEDTDTDNGGEHGDGDGTSRRQVA